MRKLLVVLAILAVIVIGVLLVINIKRDERHAKFGNVKDEALQAGRLAATMPGADEDYYADMDYGITRNPELVRQALDPFVPGIGAQDAVKAVVRGRNNWVVWTAGNDRLWDVLSNSSVGNLDLLKTVSNHPSLKFSRSNRWSYFGLVNEPCYKKSTGPRADRFGLWLDVRDPACGADPFENENKYPGVRIGARGKNIPVGSYYGYGTGILGLRLFPNPAFDEDAQEKWDPVRYYTDPTYYNDAKLVKPYRVGMSCGFCHIGPSPTRPPADFENPKWENLISNPGAQYFWIDRIFLFEQDQTNYVWQLFHTSRPGALDTSLVSSDQINNPRTMNAIYNLAGRIDVANRFGLEQLGNGSDRNKQFNNYLPAASPLNRNFDPATKQVKTTHVLKDGSDAVGPLGALNRVYLNIGLFSEEWLLHFIPLLGGADITPIDITSAERNSTYWNANTAQTPDVALFFLATAKPDYLSQAPGGPQELAKDAARLTRGKEVFADRCARCHSSYLPKAAEQYMKPGCIGPNYMQCWDAYWKWTKTPQFRAEMRQIVMNPNFLNGNFLSNEFRVPVTLLQTNACSPLATNALRGNIWDNFSSESYKQLPSVGSVKLHKPYSMEPYWYKMPGDGRGFTRPASLVSVWSTAPFLLNNSLGKFDGTGTVQGRLASFNDSITQLLWPERRTGNVIFETASGKKGPGWVDVTTQTSYLRVAPGYLPKDLDALSGPLDRFFPNVFGSGGVQIGPVPKGTPVNLLSNINLQKKAQVLGLLLRIKHDLDKLPADATDEQAKKQFAPLVDKLVNVSKCPDYIVNRGHYFGTDYLPPSEGEPGLSDEDKYALIAYLKTL